MKNFKILSKLRAGNYFRELSIVIIGIAVTFFVNGLINDFKEKKDLELQIQAVYAELEDNLEKINILNLYYENIAELQNYLLANINSPQALNDSIGKYANSIGLILSFDFKKGAYDMLINSGSMRLVSNRKKLLDITECYRSLEVTKQDHVIYTNTYLQLIILIFQMTPQTLLNFDITSAPFQSMFNFYAHVNIPVNVEDTRRQIEKTLLHKLK